MYESQPRMIDVKAAYLLFKKIVNVVSETLEIRKKVLFDRLCEKNLVTNTQPVFGGLTQFLNYCKTYQKPHYFKTLIPLKKFTNIFLDLKL